MGNDIVPSETGYPIEPTLWGLPCFLDLMLLASSWLVIYGFSNCSFFWHWAIQNWYSFCWLWTNQDWRYLFVLTDFGRVSYFTEFGQDVRLPKRIPALSDKKFKSSRTTHRIWHKSCSIIQSAEIINWIGSPVNKIQRRNLLLLSVTRSSHFCKKIRIMIRSFA